jgi:hypothetical protein
MIEINRNPSPSQLRQFSLLWFPAFWAMVGMILWRRFDLFPVAVVLWSAAGVLGILGGIRPPLMRRVYVGMSLATYPIGWVVSHLVLGIVYYLVITPIGLAMRLIGRDPMQRRFDRSAPTYWIARDPEPAKERYFKQY